MEDCVFCKIARREIDAPILFEDNDVVAFADASPAAPTHILVIPRRHIAGVDDLAPEDTVLAGRLLLVARRLAAERRLDASGYRLVVNSGADGGQTVPHLHIHLLGGRPLDAHMG